MQLVVAVLLLVGLWFVPGLDAQTLNWINKQPIARWFIAEHTAVSVTNPRGYFNNPAVNALDPTAFRTEMLIHMDDVLYIMGGMDPQPQGIIIWDIEGQEFPHQFTYIGNPPLLSTMAPEMDALADEIFATLKAHGYGVGVTIRPQHFTTGPTLPETCHWETAYQYWDIHILTSETVGPPSERLWFCSAPDTWDVTIESGGFQTYGTTNTIVYNTLHDKIAYAVSRWGITFAYIDSTVDVGGVSLNASIFQQLQEDFPQVLLIPEFTAVDTWSYAAAYWGVAFDTAIPPTGVEALYPDAFAVIQPFATDLSLPDNQSRLRQHIRNGNIIFVDGWWLNPQNIYVLTAYLATATSLNSTWSGVGYSTTISSSGPILVPSTAP